MFYNFQFKGLQNNIMVYNAILVSTTNLNST